MRRTTGGSFGLLTDPGLSMNAPRRRSRRTVSIRLFARPSVNQRLSVFAYLCAFVGFSASVRLLFISISFCMYASIVGLGGAFVESMPFARRVTRV